MNKSRRKPIRRNMYFSIKLWGPRDTTLGRKCRFRKRSVVGYVIMVHTELYNNIVLQ